MTVAGSQRGNPTPTACVDLSAPRVWEVGWLSVVGDSDVDDSGHLRMIVGGEILRHGRSFTGLQEPAYSEVGHPSRMVLSLVRSASTRRLNAHLINAVNGR